MQTAYADGDVDALWDFADTFQATLRDAPGTGWAGASGARAPVSAALEASRCDFCGGGDIVLDDGNFVCKKCNILNDRLIDAAAEWRYFGHEDNKSSDPTRCGMPTSELLPDSSLGTIIANRIGESYEMRILRKYQMWNSMSYKERSLYNIFDNLSLNATNSGIPVSIIDDAKMLYKRISEAKITRGENRSGLIASSIYMACKRNNVPRSAKEIAKIFNLRCTTMTRGCKRFQEILPIDMPTCTNACDFIQRFASRLGLNREIRDICTNVTMAVEAMSVVSENTPPSNWMPGLNQMSVTPPEPAVESATISTIWSQW